MTEVEELPTGISAGSYPEPAEAKQTPVLRSSVLSDGSKYGGTSSLTPKYEAVTRYMLTSNTQIKRPYFDIT